MDQQEHHHAAHENATMRHHLNALEEFFETYLHKKLGLHLPKGFKDFIVQYGPWLMLIVVILGILSVLPMLRFCPVWAPDIIMAIITIPGVFFDLQVLIGLAVLIMEAVAIPGLLKRKFSAWHLVYYAWLLWAVGQLLALSLVNLILGLLVGMYLLFQIREYYH